jgi:hypothetical protein
MPDEFLDRLREAAVRPEKLDRDALARAAANASVELSADRALTLVRLAHGRSVGPTLESNIRQRLNFEGQVIASSGAEQMLSLLAAESLIDLFGRRIQDVGLVPALAVRCASHAGWRVVHPDLAHRSDAYLARRSIEARLPLSPEASLAKAKPRAEEGVDLLAEQFDYLRQIVSIDRRVLFERDRLLWWLASETRAASAAGVAADFLDCLVFVPEPPATAELIAAKLKRAPSRSERPPQLDSPSDLTDLCPDLGDPTPAGETPATAESTRRVLDQLLLLRSHREAKR